MPDHLSETPGPPSSFHLCGRETASPCLPFQCLRAQSKLAAAGVGVMGCKELKKIKDQSCLLALADPEAAGPFDPAC